MQNDSQRNPDLLRRLNDLANDIDKNLAIDSNRILVLLYTSFILK